MRKISSTCFIAALAIGLLTPNLRAQVTLVKQGEPTSRIVVTSNEKTDQTAALLLQDFIKRISDAELPIVKGKKTKAGDVLIGNGNANQDFITETVTEDGFRICTKDNMLRIISGGDKGSIYGVATLLEKYMGVEYWGENEYSLQKSKDIIIPTIDLSENPAFRYRQSQFYGMHTDPTYKLMMRLEEPQEVFAAGYWVHTSNRLLPSSVYGKSHPEYYSFFNGKRHPGQASQWCLSNEEVFNIVAERIDSIFEANPGFNIISVSQNDGYTYCQCDRCKAINEYEGSLSGTIIRFLNRLAERRPDKEFSTLAYLFSMNPPKHTQPLPNVNIMLCDIDCDREVTLTENKSGQYFVKAMEGWSRITDNIFVWDYGINFDNYLMPFPNFHIMAQNMRLFKKNHTQMHFFQIAGSRGGDFAEMRTWIGAKLLWDPYQDTDQLMNRFLNGYYGKAAPYLYRYIKMVEGALLGSGHRLWIYDSPVSHIEGMLKPLLLKRYASLFNQAEEAVKDDSICLARVQRTRLPLLYSELEIARAEGNMDAEIISEKLDYFEEQVKRYQVKTLNERSNSPVDYCNIYRKRFMPSKEKNIALGAKIEYVTPLPEKYAKLGETALTDGLFGGQIFGESWIGWEGQDATLIVDLGEKKEIKSISADFLHHLGSWILLPKRVIYSLSEDGKRFNVAGNHEIPESNDVRVKYVDVEHQFDTPAQTRYIKVEIEGTKICPHWHYGVGLPCWFFIDEITVR